MKLATWNVNSVRKRLPHLLAWLDAATPDVVALQELKCETAAMPRAELEAAGWHLAVVGQKSYNGVAVVSRHPIQVLSEALPGDPEDTQARYVEVETGGIRFVSLYLPNGNPAPGDKYTYKLGWMRRLIDHTRTLLAAEVPFVLAGDYNVCPTDDDVYDPAGWQEDALVRPDTRRLYRELIYLGLTDAYRVLNPEPHRYSFWDYQKGAWQKDHGLRIDHLLLAPTLADRLAASGIDRGPRGGEEPSDHTPVWCRLTQ
ncbi:MAG: exodeoxyribonuclease III [Alphaproteobacteria bacterium]|nr:MAG: exodeoxyribonuclease III [Alphaproteobacteria bacterium]